MHIDILQIWFYQSYLFHINYTIFILNTIIELFKENLVFVIIIQLKACLYLSVRFPWLVFKICNLFCIISNNPSSEWSPVVAWYLSFFCLQLVQPGLVFHWFCPITNYYKFSLIIFQLHSQIFDTYRKKNILIKKEKPESLNPGLNTSSVVDGLDQ